MVAFCRCVDPSVVESKKLKHITKGIHEGTFQIIVIKTPTSVAAWMKHCTSLQEVATLGFVCFRRRHLWLPLTSSEARSQFNPFTPSSVMLFAKRWQTLGSPRHLRCSLPTIRRSVLYCSTRACHSDSLYFRPNHPILPPTTTAHVRSPLGTRPPLLP